MNRDASKAAVELVLVVAHAQEAGPLLKLFDLSPGERKPFRTYRNRKGLALIVCGTGRVAAAAATAHIGATLASERPVTHEDDECSPGFLNIGVAGHGDAETGTGFLINRVRERASGRVFYPTPLPTRYAGCTLVTVDRAELDYAESVAYDMEGAGFWSAAVRYAPLDRIQLYKIVSDNRAQDARSFERAETGRLLEAHRPRISSLVRELQQLCRGQQAVHALPQAWRDWTATLHLSVSQRHELKTLLRRCRALGLEGELQAMAEGATGARALLHRLRRRLAGAG